MSTLKLSEIFYSLQGEGPMTGRPAFFIRTAGCNLNCGINEGSTWRCDTWDIMRSTKLMLTPSQLTAELDKLAKIDYQSLGIRYVFTGGEPLLQADALSECFEYLTSEYYDGGKFIDIETNGTLFDERVFTKLKGYAVVSPKLANSNIPEATRFKPEAIKSILKSTKHPIFKFVISNDRDVEEIMDAYVPLLGARWKQITWFMPGMDRLEGTMPVKQYVWNKCAELQVPMAVRAHIEVFNRKTSV